MQVERVNSGSIWNISPNRRVYVMNVQRAFSWVGGEMPLQTRFTSIGRLLHDESSYRVEGAKECPD
jgi:hypothetical protein